MIVDQIVRFEELLPRLLPARSIEATEGHDPGERIVRRGVRWPGPDGVRMKERQKSIRTRASHAAVSRSTMQPISFWTVRMTAIPRSPKYDYDIT